MDQCLLSRISQGNENEIDRFCGKNRSKKSENNLGKRLNHR